MRSQALQHRAEPGLRRRAELRRPAPLRPVAAAGHGTVRYETLAAFVDHPVYPTARCRIGLSDDELTAYAPEFAPAFELRWAAVPRERQAGAEMPEAPGFATVGLDERLAETHVLFPVHPLTVPAVEEIPWAIMGPEPYLEVRPTLSMRTVEIAVGTHLKLPLTTSTLGLRNRRSIKPDTLADGARAELLLREMPDPGVVLADEQTYGHAGHEYLGWLLRRHPGGRGRPGGRAARAPARRRTRRGGARRALVRRGRDAAARVVPAAAVRVPRAALRPVRHGAGGPSAEPLAPVRRRSRQAAGQGQRRAADLAGPAEERGRRGARLRRRTDADRRSRTRSPTCS